jgi:hypothetical protein
MTDSHEPNVSSKTAPATKKRDERTASKKHVESRSAALPDWAPWAVLGGLIVAGAVGSRAVQAAVASSEASKAAAGGRAKAAPSTMLTAAPPAASANSAPSARAASADKISALHLVVTYADSVMGKSLHITRSREQALQRASEALSRARKGEDFSRLVTEYSEEPQTDQTHGELKNFTRKDAIPSFADAAFKLKVGELSPVVDTPYGYMVILRTK